MIKLYAPFDGTHSRIYFAREVIDDPPSPFLLCCLEDFTKHEAGAVLLTSAPIFHDAYNDATALGIFFGRRYILRSTS